MAVMLKAVAWLATAFAKTSTIFINENCIVLAEDMLLRT